MIGYLEGEILDYSDGKVLLGVGEKGKVGYVVSIPQSVSYADLGVGNRVELFIYTHVREDSLDLFGFRSRSEKNLFLTLLNVNGIGPKSALGILSSVDPGALIEAIVQEDQAFLTRIPGIGKKTAERVVVELRDTVRKKMETGNYPSQTVSIKPQSNSFFQDAKSALMGLGYREPDAHQILSRVLTDQEFKPTSPEDLIRRALKQLA